MAKVAGLKACGDSTVLPLSKGGYAESKPIDEHGFAQAGILMTSGCLDGCLVGSRACCSWVGCGAHSLPWSCPPALHVAPPAMVALLARSSQPTRLHVHALAGG